MRVNCMHYKRNKNSQVKDKNGSRRKQHKTSRSVPMAHLDTAKLLFYSVLSRKNSKFMTLDIANFYLVIPMKDYECSRINLFSIPEDILKEWNLHKISHNS